MFRSARGADIPSIFSLLTLRSAYLGGLDCGAADSYELILSTRGGLFPLGPRLPDGRHP